MDRYRYHQGEPDPPRPRKPAIQSQHPNRWMVCSWECTAAAAANQNPMVNELMNVDDIDRWLIYSFIIGID